MLQVKIATTNNYFKHLSKNLYNPPHSVQVTVPFPPPWWCSEIHLTNVQRPLSNCLLLPFLGPYSNISLWPSYPRSRPWYNNLLSSSYFKVPVIDPSCFHRWSCYKSFATFTFKWNIHSGLLKVDLIFTNHLQRGISKVILIVGIIYMLDCHINMMI